MSKRLQSERGVSLVESLIAVAILGTALVVFLAGISTGSLATGQTDKLSTAHELARSQMEHTKDEPFAAAPYTYPSVTAPSGYSVTSTASAIGLGDASVQLIAVQVDRDGAPVFTLEGFKVDR